MSSLLEDMLADVVASFGSEVPMETATGYGVDIDCTDDIDPMFGLVDGVRVVAQAIYRRLTTPRGMVIDAPNYGFDVRSLLHKGMTPAEQASIPGIVRAEVLKDERIERVDVEVTDVTPDSFSLTIRCQTGEGPFRLTLNVAAAAVLLTEIGS